METFHSKIRTFIGIPLSLMDRDRLHATIKPLVKRLTDLRWVRPENWHLTIRFLGKVDSRTLAILKQAAAEEANKIEKFNLNIIKIDRFPPEKHRILAAYVENQKALSQLFFNLNQAAEKAGLAREERVFLPHITLAKSSGSIRSFEPVDCKLSISAETLVVFESRPNNNGSQYLPLYKFPFSLH